ncbi:MAG: ABC transporter permease [Gemmatimonadales bacterium]
MSGPRGFRWARLLAVSRKEVIQLRRDTRSLILAFILPAVLVLLFGYAISWDVLHIPLAVYDQDGTATARDLVEGFRSSGYFDIEARVRRYPEAEALLDEGKVRLVLVIPRGFAADLHAGRPADLQALVDGGDANTATIALGYAQAIIGSFSSDAVLQGRRLALPARAEVRVWYNETLVSRNMIVPGLVAVIMMIIAAMLTSLTIAREWERGTMEQLAATPVHRVEVILGKLLPYLILGLFDLVLTVLLGITIFHVPFRGSFLFLLGASTVFLFGSLGLGIFISAAIRSQLLATQVSMLVSYLPGFLLSGFAFDIRSMPGALQWVTYLVPARYYVVIIKAVFLKGVGPAALWPQGLALILFGIAGAALAVRSFRKQI